MLTVGVSRNWIRVSDATSELEDGLLSPEGMLAGLSTMQHVDKLQVRCISHELVTVNAYSRLTANTIVRAPKGGRASRLPLLACLSTLMAS